MKAFGLVGKQGRPRYQTDPLVDSDEEVEEEMERAVYTPIEDDDADRASTISRMSIG